jgi:aminoglycoside 6'-N-acetyltransferase
VRRGTRLDSTSVTFRPLVVADLPMMQRWLNEPHVREWWDDPGPSLAEVEREYGPCIAGTDPTRGYVVSYGDQPIGFVQEYLLSDHADYGRLVWAEPGAVALDLFIGEPDFVHRGLGGPMLRRFLEEVVFVRPGVTAAVIGPAVGNRAAIRAYEKAGFAYVKTVAIPGEAEPEYVMHVDRERIVGR